MVLKIVVTKINKGMNLFERIVGFLENIALYISSFILVCMTLLITVDTLFRYFLHKPITGVLEVTEYVFMVAIVFFGMSYTSREGGHIRVDFLSRSLPKVFKTINEVIFNLITIGFFLIISFQAWKQTVNALRINQLSVGAVEFPMAPAFFLVVIGSLLLCLRLFINTLKTLLSKKLGD